LIPRRLGFRFSVVSSSFLGEAGCGAQSRCHSQTAELCQLGNTWLGLCCSALVYRRFPLCLSGISETARKPTVEKGSSSLRKGEAIFSSADVEGAQAGLLDCGHRSAVSLSRGGEDTGSADLIKPLLFLLPELTLVGSSVKATTSHSEMTAVNDPPALCNFSAARP
ncbi:hypothetical protein GOODEAATRI_014188, partial [Goodea atripinnis]